MCLYRVVEAIEFIPRHERAGLGADVSGLKKKKRRKIGEEENTRGEMTVAADADGKIRHYRTLDEKLIRRRPTYLAPVCRRRYWSSFRSIPAVFDSRFL